MKKTFQYTIATVLLLTSLNQAFAQKKDENIGTEVVNVVKPYSPTISDAFKVKETPTLDDNETSKKESIQYTIFSFPVASTFVPSKGKAVNVDKSPSEKYFSNYMTLGAGNYGNINTELFVTENFNNTDYFGGMFRYNSSQGGIKNVRLDNKYFNTALDLTYGSRTKSATWNADLGYKNQIYNWYGIDNSLFTNAQVVGMKVQQSYNTLYVGGRLSLEDSFLKESTLKLTRFWDTFGSAENRLETKPSVVVEVFDKKVNANFVVDYLNGSFAKNYFDTTSINYRFANIGFEPSVKIKQDDLILNAGVGLFYSASQGTGTSRFFVYPQVTGTYNLVDNLMVLYAGLEGTLHQNSYHDFVQENFFVSPTIAIVPTDQKCDLYLGLKGKLQSNISYNIRGSYKNESNKGLFKSNGYDHFNSNQNGYTNANSFDIVYDKLKTVSFFGELRADFSKNISFGVNGTFSSFTTDIEKEAWNLPTIKLASNLDITISPKWSVSTSLFFVGKRRDVFRQYSVDTNYDDQFVTLKSYFDLNTHVSYKYNERWTFFLKGNNLANQNYQKWLNYPVQGLQVLGGASYKFDF